MPASSLPVPESAGPIAGAPGHFAHHDWLTASVKALDQLAGNRSIFVQHGPANTQSPATNTFIAISLITTMAKSPLCPAYTVGGTNNGSLTLGDSWPTGMYRADWSVAWAAPGSPTYGTSSRSSRVLVNAVVPVTVPNVVNYTQPGQSNRPVPVIGTGILFLKPLDVVTLEGRQDSGSGLDTNVNSCFLQLGFMFPCAAAVSP